VVVYDMSERVHATATVAWRRLGQRVGRALANENAQRIDVITPTDADLGHLFVAGISAGVPNFKSTNTSKPQKRDLRLVDWTPAAVQRTATLCQAQQFARDLTNTPAADLGPAEFVARTRQAIRGTGLQLTIIDAKGLKEKGAGAHLAVGAAAPKNRAPRLLKLSWPGAGPKRGKKSPPAAWSLCGKGICFDTGGLQIKPGGAMQLMRKDMGGAATVVGALLAAAAEKPKHRIDAWLPLTDNAIDGNAFRPGDVLTAVNGTTIEVGHTDAEGRLVLADAICLAAQEKPQAIVTVATLTGAALVALGRIHVPIMGHDGVVGDLLGATEMAGEQAWSLPLTQDHRNLVRGTFADLTNSAGPDASCITAGAFLEHFAGNTPFAHCDISPASWQPSKNDVWAAGATGTFVSTLAELISQPPNIS
jgi:leucyl aminopeptidase